jgi:hypothetical protein
MRKSTPALHANLGLTSGLVCEFGVSGVSHMTMKLCANQSCSIYGHIVYTHATRCTCCRWDLRPARNKSAEPLTETIQSAHRKGVGIESPPRPV